MKIYLIKTNGDELADDEVTCGITLSKDVAIAETKEWNKNWGKFTCWIEEYEVNDTEVTNTNVCDTTVTMIWVEELEAQKGE